MICQVRPGQASDHGHSLRNLRHGAATLVLAAGPDLRIVQDQLGHSSIVLTADTYISVLPQTARAQDTAGSSSPPPPRPREHLRRRRPPAARHGAARPWPYRG